MSQKQNKKTLRHFQCRDFLWEIFEQMSAELECSIDYLINEAMRQYARARNYSPQGMSMPGGDLMGGGGAMPRPSNAGPPQRLVASSGAAPRPPVVSPRPGPPPPLPGSSAPRPRPPQPIPPAGGMPQGGQYDYQSQQPPPMMPGDGANAPAPRQSGAGGYANIPGYGGPGPSASPVAGVPQQSPAMGSQPPAEGQLYLIFNGRKTAITKEQFIIGRGSKTSDLPIKDGNISRKHAAIINHRGVYFIKDMGSTNGIEYNGMRIDNKRIEEGDVFHICDYEIRFTYR